MFFYYIYGTPTVLWCVFHELASTGNDFRVSMKDKELQDFPCVNYDLSLQSAVQRMDAE